MNQFDAQIFDSDTIATAPRIFTEDALVQLRAQLLKTGDVEGLTPQDLADLIFEVLQARSFRDQVDLQISDLIAARDNAEQALALNNATNADAINLRAQLQEAIAARDATAVECNGLLAQAAQALADAQASRDTAAQTLAEQIAAVESFQLTFKNFFKIQ